MAFRTKSDGLQRATGYFYEGREIALSKQPGTPVKKKRHAQNWWPDTKKIEAATLYAVLRDFQKVSDLTGIPVHYIEPWVIEPWWDEIILKVKKEKNEKLDSVITEVLAKGLEIVEDRFANGEIMVDRKTKQEYRVPVNVKNVSIVIDAIFDKRQLIRGEATTRTEVIDSEKKLEQLKNNFEKLAKSKLINPDAEPIEGLIINGTSEGQSPQQIGSSNEQEKQAEQPKRPETGIQENPGELLNAS